MNEPQRVARTLGERIEATGAPVTSIVLHGSAVLGGWMAGRSDLDLLVIVEDDIGHADLVKAVGVLVAFDADAAGIALEASVVTRGAAGRDRDRWPYLAHVNSHRRPAIVDTLSAPDADDPDLLMHYAVARQAGIAVTGEPPERCIAPVARRTILQYLAGEVRWGLAHAPAAYAILTMCRARVFLDEGAIVSKMVGGSQVLLESAAPREAIAAAIAWQRGGATEPIVDDGVRACIERTAQALTNASRFDE